MNKNVISAVHKSLAKKIGEPKTELNYCNPYTFLVSAVLSAEATDKSVNAAMEDLFKVVKTKTADQTQEILDQIKPKKWLKTAHHLLILHGRYTCKSQNPLCGQCKVIKLCNYNNKNEENKKNISS